MRDDHVVVGATCETARIESYRFNFLVYGVDGLPRLDGPVLIIEATSGAAPRAAFDTLSFAVYPVAGELAGPWQTSSIWTDSACHVPRGLSVISNRPFLLPRKLLFLLHSASFDAIVQRAGRIRRQMFHKDPAIAFSGCNEGNPPNAVGGRSAINSIWISKIHVPLRDVTGVRIDHPSGGLAVRQKFLFRHSIFIHNHRVSGSSPGAPTIQSS
jgi:hypothetical protein